MGEAILAELKKNPISCNKNSVHLSFDDGPSTKVTPVLLSELKKRNVKGSFFVSTTNLAATHANHRENAEIVRKAMDEGHLIASHGHEHHAYDLRIDSKGKVLEEGYSDRDKERQVERSVELLNQVTNNRFSKQKHVLFRLPYGRGAMPSPKELEHMESHGHMRFTSNDYSDRLKEYRQQSPALSVLADSGFSHLGWNNDSGDSRFGNGMLDNTKMKSFIVDNLKSMCSGRSVQVALFHDIKEFNTVSIPVLMDVGKCLGLNFISADQMMQQQKALSDAGVLISRSKIQSGTAKTIEDILKTVEGAGKVECKEESTHKGCYSEQYKKTYKECEGGSSICYGGRWYSRQDPVVVLNCNITDETPKKKTCYSEQYRKTYQSCEGGNSICYDGRWYARRDPEVILNCNLTD